MDWYYYIALVAIVSQVFFSFHVYKNYRYALNKYKRDRCWYRPRTVLIVPCKGRDMAFQKNITSFFQQDYDNYLLWFVVADEADPAYSHLCNLKNQLTQTSKAKDIQIFIAGHVEQSNVGCCSQKIHNLLYCYERLEDDIDVLAFADSDICVGPNWLSHLVYPLRESKNGAAAGYRWFVPKENNIATLALSAVNAKIAQLLGNSRLNQAWGGSMAIRAELFRELQLDKIWRRSISDDFSLSRAVKKAKLKITFVPACLVASSESISWPKLFEFGRRQFLITRVTVPETWWFGLLSCLYSVLGLWIGIVLAVYAAFWTTVANAQLAVFIAVPIVFFASQFARAILRQKMIGKLLKEYLPELRFAMAADILLFWVWSLLLLIIILSSAFGRTISWRGIRYKLLGPTETVRIS